MDFFATSDVCELFKVSHQTVKTWSREFALYLSPTASPEKGKKRLFTTEDLEVFALVHDYHQRGFVYEDAHLALRSGQRGNVPTNQSELTPTVPPTLLVSLRNRIADLEREVINYRSEADDAKGQTRLLRELLAEKEAQIKSLYLELGKLAGKLQGKD